MAVTQPISSVEEIPPRVTYGPLYRRETQDSNCERKRKLKHRGEEPGEGASSIDICTHFETRDFFR